MKKIVFISAFQSFVSRNILNTGVLEEFLEGGARVVIFVPSAKEEFYKTTYANSNVVIEPFDVDTYLDTKEKWFRNLAELLIDTNVMRFRKTKKLFLTGNFVRYAYQILVTAVLGRSRVIKEVFRWLEFRFNHKDAFGYYIKKYRPDVVFATDVFGTGDVFLLKSARLHSVKTVGMVASWDNNTTKGLMRVIPDKVLVQNKIIEEESVSIQNVPAVIITVVGIAHFDYYKEYQPASREDFFRAIGIDPKKRLIMFAPAGDKFITTDWQICEILKQAYENQEIPGDVVTLVRIHPTNPVELHNFVPDEHFLIETPGVKFEGMADKRKELDRHALHHLLETLAHVDLVMNVVSSMVIDAAVFDKPVITIGFDGWERRIPFARSVRRYHADENMAKLLAIGGTPLVKTRDELIWHINNYLAHPEVDREGRRRIVDAQCWKLDGKAKIRIAEAVIGQYK